METDSTLIAAMARQCRMVIQEWDGIDGTDDSGLPAILRPTHLFWMCKKIEQHAHDWTATRLHRWIGFVQCAMMANRMIDLAGAKELFQQARTVNGKSVDVEALIDHLDEQNSFEFDVGGEG